MPPLHMVVDVVLYAILPAALVAAVLTAAVRLLGGAKLGPLGAALGLAGGFFVGNWLRETLPLIPGESAWNRLPWVALAVLAVGLVARLPRVPLWARWLLRAATAAAAAWCIVPADVRLETTWLPAALGATILAEWALLEVLALGPHGGVSVTLALTAFSAAAVLIHAGTARYMDVETVLAAALLGVGAAAWGHRSDEGGAIPGAVVVLLGVLLMGQQETETFSDVPWTAFAVAACAPLVLTVTLLPPLCSLPRTRLCLLRFALLLVPLVVAVLLAAQAGPLEFE